MKSKENETNKNTSKKEPEKPVSLLPNVHGSSSKAKSPGGKRKSFDIKGMSKTENIPEIIPSKLPKPQTGEEVRIQSASQASPKPRSSQSSLHSAKIQSIASRSAASAKSKASYLKKKPETQPRLLQESNPEIKNPNQPQPPSPGAEMRGMFDFKDSDKSQTPKESQSLTKTAFSSKLQPMKPPSKDKTNDLHQKLNDLRKNIPKDEDEI